MFGYVMVNQQELKVKEYEQYRAYYCGLCIELKKRYGIKGQLLLSYDMTFLVILLTSLYEKKLEQTQHRCPAHQMKKCSYLVNEFTEYAADMTILFSYQNFKDDWLDNRSYSKNMYAGILKKSYIEVRKKYKRQSKAIEDHIKLLHIAERDHVYNPEYVSGLTGEMLKEIFIIERDQWTDNLGEIGYFIGKFIYLMDAYEDFGDDLKKSLYNPLIGYKEKADFEERCYGMLTYMASRSAMAFERLPLIQDVGLLRNIVYSGIWSKYRSIQKIED